MAQSHAKRNSDYGPDELASVLPVMVGDRTYSSPPYVAMVAKGWQKRTNKRDIENSLSHLPDPEKMEEGWPY